MTTPQAIFAGLATIALAIFAGQFASPAGSQVALPSAQLAAFMPATPYSQGKGDQAPAIWRMNAQTSRVSWCTAGSVTEAPVCSPWSKKEVVQHSDLNG